MGIEITQQRKLGIVAKSICNVILNFIQRVQPDIHYSFGENKVEESVIERPHLVFPLSIERVVVSKPGQTPPKLGCILPETFQFNRNGDKKHPWSVVDLEWNTTDTYTLSFNSMYIDLSRWKTVNLPVKDIDLRSFWGESQLRMVAYELCILTETSITTKKQKNTAKSTWGLHGENAGADDFVSTRTKHDARHINYVFCAQVSDTISVSFMANKGRLCPIAVARSFHNFAANVLIICQAKYHPDGTVNASPDALMRNISTSSTETETRSSSSIPLVQVRRLLNSAKVQVKSNFATPETLVNSESVCSDEKFQYVVSASSSSDSISEVTLLEDFGAYSSKSAGFLFGLLSSYFEAFVCCHSDRDCRK